MNISPIWSNTSASANLSLPNTSVFTRGEDIALKFFYVLVSFAAVMGNSGVCFLILNDKKIQNTVNLLLLNLSISDIISAIAVYPYLFLDISKTNLKYTGANLMCGFTEGLTIFFAASLVNLLTLSVLSLSRYMLINHPTKHKWRVKKHSVKWISVFTWTVGISLLIPSGVSFHYNSENKICWRRWAKGIILVLYFIATMVISFLIPLCTLTFTYISTIHTLWFKKSLQRLQRTNSQTSVQSSRKRISILLGMLIVVFLVCWSPFGIYWLLSAALSYFPDTVEGQRKMIRITRYTILIALLNTCLDPMVYAYSNRQITNGARRTILRRKGTINTVEPTATE